MRKPLPFCQILPISLFMLLIWSGNSMAADFIDDWIAMKSVAGPSSFENQKRGFISGGSASMRWPMGKDYLVTVSPPRMPTAGCGGIDAYLGGIGFLDAEYLIEKLKRIMGDAGATFFFKIALGTVTEQINKELDSLEGMVNALNGLQLDDCKASKTVVAALDGGINGDMNAAREAVYDFYTTTGTRKLFQEVTKRAEASDGTVSGSISKASSGAGTKSDLIAGCETDVKDAFGTPGSLIEHLAHAQGYGEDYVNYLSALVGDVKITAGLDYKYLPPCMQMNPDRLDTLYDGALYKKNLTTDACVPVTISNGSGAPYPTISAYVRDNLEIIADAIINGINIPAPQQVFINTLPAGIYNGLDSEILSLGDKADKTMVADDFVDIASATYTYSIIKDLYTILRGVVETADTMIKNTKGSSATPGPSGATPAQYTCQYSLFKEPYAQIVAIRDKTKELKDILEKDYDRHVERYVRFIEMQKAQLLVTGQVKSKNRKGIQRNNEN